MHKYNDITVIIRLIWAFLQYNRLLTEVLKGSMQTQHYLKRPNQTHCLKPTVEINKVLFNIRYTTEVYWLKAEHYRSIY